MHRTVTYSALVAALVVTVVHQRHAMSEAEVRVADGVIEIALHGDTPTMSWSPDGRRLVFNSAFTYGYGDRELAPHRSELGIYVLDPKSRALTRVTGEQGYHPAWLDRRTVVWGHSNYEEGKPGLFVSPAGRSAVRRVGRFDGVNHTLVANDGDIIFYAGFPEARGWQRIDTKSGESSRLFGASRSSWLIPRDLVRDQCPQRVGRTALSLGFSDGELRHIVSVAGRRRVLDGAPLLFGVDSLMVPPAHRGPVRGCLSPNGRWVAYATAAGKEAMTLRVALVQARR